MPGLEGQTRDARQLRKVAQDESGTYSATGKGIDERSRLHPLL
jgi:hypothetical protein